MYNISAFIVFAASYILVYMEDKYQLNYKQINPISFSDIERRRCNNVSSLSYPRSFEDK